LTRLTPTVHVNCSANCSSKQLAECASELTATLMPPTFALVFRPFMGYFPDFQPRTATKRLAGLLLQHLLKLPLLVVGGLVPGHPRPFSVFGIWHIYKTVRIYIRLPTV
jgi:hypothetical protein